MKHLKDSKFITFEGIEGVGKSTLIRFLANKLSINNIPYVVTREPGGTKLGEALRNILLHEKCSITNMAELLIVFASRAQHLEEIIKPALKNNQWVICDRFIDATYAYQGAGRKMNIENIQTLEKLVVDDILPDYTFVLDAPINVSFARIQNRMQLDRFEVETVDFFERIREAYLQRALLNPTRYKVIDATLSIEEVQQSIWDVLQYEWV